MISQIIAGAIHSQLPNLAVQLDVSFGNTCPTATWCFRWTLKHTSLRTLHFFQMKTTAFSSLKGVRQPKLSKA